MKKSSFRVNHQERNATIATVMVGSWHVIIHQMTKCGKIDHDYDVMKCIGDNLQKMMLLKGANVLHIGQALHRSHLMQKGKENSGT